MKKRWMLAVFAGLCISVCGCGKTEEPAPSAPVKETEPAEENPTVETNVTDDLDLPEDIEDNIDDIEIFDEWADLGELGEITYNVDDNSFTDSIDTDLEVGVIPFGNYVVSYPILEGFEEDGELFVSDEKTYYCMSYINDRFDFLDVVVKTDMAFGASAENSMEMDSRFEDSEKLTKEINGVIYHYAYRKTPTSEGFDVSWLITCDLKDGWVIEIEVKALDVDYEISLEEIAPMMNIGLTEN